MINMAKIELMNHFLEYIPPFKEWIEGLEGTGKHHFVDKWNGKSEDVDCMEGEKKEPSTFDVTVRYTKRAECARLKAYVILPTNQSILYDVCLTAYFAFDSELMEVGFTCRIEP